MINNDAEQFRETAFFTKLWLLLRQDKIALISFYAFLFLIFLVLFGSLLAPYSSNQQFVGSELMPPSWYDQGEIKYFFGTDDLGRDIFSRLFFGFYYTVGSALLISFVIAILGSLIGVLAGINHKKRSLSILSHLFDTFLFTPILLIAIVIATLMEASLINAMLAIFLAMLPHFIHQVYQETQQQLNREYVITLKLDNASAYYLIKKVIFANLATSSIKSLSHIFVIAILDISALSFISLGAKSPTPEWGAMIRDSMELIYIAPWTVAIPGIAIITAIFIVTLFGNSLSRVLEKAHH